MKIGQFIKRFTGGSSESRARTVEQQLEVLRASTTCDSLGCDGYAISVATSESFQQRICRTCDTLELREWMVEVDPNIQIRSLS